MKQSKTTRIKASINRQSKSTQHNKTKQNALNKTKNEHSERNLIKQLITYITIYSQTMNPNYYQHKTDQTKQALMNPTNRFGSFLNHIQNISHECRISDDYISS